jgi:hypothetical protein
VTFEAYKVKEQLVKCTDGKGRGETVYSWAFSYTLRNCEESGVVKYEVHKDIRLFLMQSCELYYSLLALFKVLLSSGRRPYT